MLEHQISFMASGQLPFPSEQARFYVAPPLYEAGIPPGLRVAKVYSQTLNLFGMVDLANLAARDRLITTEMQYLEQMAPVMQPRRERVLLTDGNYSDAIVMRLLPKDAFLESRIIANEPISSEILQQVASAIHTYQANPELHYPVKVESYTEYMKGIFAGLLTEVKGVRSHDVNQYEQWEAQIMAYIEKNAEPLNRRQTELNQPHMGHGDLKAANMIEFEGEIGILDPAPCDEWRVSDSRMEATFLRTELILAGRPEEAAAYWNEYTRLSHQDPRALANQDTEVAIDTLAHLYHLILFHMLHSDSRPAVSEQAARLTDSTLKEATK